MDLVSASVLACAALEEGTYLVQKVMDARTKARAGEFVETHGVLLDAALNESYRGLRDVKKSVAKAMVEVVATDWPIKLMARAILAHDLAQDLDLQYRGHSGTGDASPSGPEMEEWIKARCIELVRELERPKAAWTPAGVLYSDLSAVAHPEGPSWSAFKIDQYFGNYQLALRGGGGAGGGGRNARTRGAVTAGVCASALFMTYAQQSLFEVSWQCPRRWPDDDGSRSYLFVPPRNYYEIDTTRFPSMKRREGQWVYLDELR